MRRALVIVGLLAVLLSSAPGCQRLDAPPPPETPKTITLDAIPLDMGDLVAVTTAPEWPGSAQLWFLKPDKSIAMVAVQMKSPRVGGTTVVIPRR